MKGPSFICAILDGYDSQRSCAAIGNGVEQKPFDPATSLHRAKTRTYSFPFSRLLFDWSSGASGSPLIDISCTRINKCFLEAPEVSGEDFEATRVHRAPRSGNPTVRCTRRAPPDRILYGTWARGISLAGRPLPANPHKRYPLIYAKLVPRMEMTEVSYPSCGLPPLRLSGMGQKHRFGRRSVSFRYFQRGSTRLNICRPLPSIDAKLGVRGQQCRIDREPLLARQTVASAESSSWVASRSAFPQISQHL